MRRKVATRLLPLIAATLALAAALEYRVDDAGGPLTLAEEVAAAFASWLEDGPAGLEAIPSDTATNLIRFGDPAELGPDVLSLTIQRQAPEGQRQVEVLLDPADYRSFPAVLLHETGLLLGLEVAPTGVMAPAIGPDSPTELSAADRELLASLQAFAREDVNRDGIVDFYDLAAIARAFERTGINLPEDINGDGTVDEADLELLEQAYTFTPPSPTPPSPTPPSPTAPSPTSPAQQPAEPTGATEDGGGPDAEPQPGATPDATPDEEATPAEPAPEQPAPEQPAPEQPVPEQPVPEQPAPDEPTPEEPAPDVPAPDNGGPGEPP